MSSCPPESFEAAWRMNYDGSAGVHTTTHFPSFPSSFLLVIIHGGWSLLLLISLTRGRRRREAFDIKKILSSNLCTVQHEMRDGTGKTRRNYGYFPSLNGATPNFLGPIFRIFLFPPLHLVPNYLLFLPPPSVRPPVQPCPRSSSQEKRRL